MCSDDEVIRVDRVSKGYPIYRGTPDRLKQMIYPRLRRLFRRSKRYHDNTFWALKDVSLTVCRGETVGIIGRNGAGKSTLLEIISGTATPTAGTVMINGRVAALLELGAGFNPEFSGRENLYLYATIMGLFPAMIAERYDAMVEFADIRDFIDQPVKSYSTGMVLRLAFAVIAHVDADILIVDEALAVGDIYFAQKCRRFFDDFKQRGTLLFVSHDMSLVHALCDRTIWLDHGKARAVGSVKNVSMQYLEAYYKERACTEALPERELKKEEAMCADDRTASHFSVRSDDQWIEENKIVLSPFDPSASSFGEGGATIYDAGFCNALNRSISWLLGSEKVTFFVRVTIQKAMQSPAIGFVIKNRNGRIVYDLSSYFPLEKKGVSFLRGDAIQARFHYRMPVLARGEYLISVAIAEGDAFDHQQLHWMHDVIKMTVMSGPFMQGDLWVMEPEIELVWEKQ